METSSNCRFPGSSKPAVKSHPLLVRALALLGALLFLLAAYSLLTQSLLYPYDSGLLARIHALSDRSPRALVTAAEVFSTAGSFGPTLIAFALAGYYLHKKCDNRFLLIMLSYGGGLLLFWLTAFLFNRERPDLPGLLAQFPFPSYPSGHVIQAVTLLAPVLYLYLPGVRSKAGRIAIIMLTLLFLAATGFVRLYLNAHYPTDVLAGYGVGLVWALFVLWMMERQDELGKRLP